MHTLATRGKPRSKPKDGGLPKVLEIDFNVEANSPEDLELREVFMSGENAIYPGDGAQDVMVRIMSREAFTPKYQIEARPIAYVARVVGLAPQQSET